eukprot:TRINITY_DN6691_c0_g1_i1.p1 TRINITY_DN6691_c0_g1~~TRINITY_DN6691_c0_g1_i1.p1  ORF type:complete len:242 (-),score=55.18 TRINITY_DN6691_c0_g1_i1:84-809(-)
MASRRKITIDIISDNVCPFCFIGKRKLEKALDKTKSLYTFEVNWHPFFLNPNAQRYEGINKIEAYNAKFGAERTKNMLPFMIEQGAAVDIKFSYGGKVGNTLDSHRLVHLSRKLQLAADAQAAQAGDSHGVEEGPSQSQHRFIEHLFKAYFEDERDICDFDTLTDIVKETGLDITPEKVKEYLASEEDVDHIRTEASDLAFKWGVSGVPFFILNQSIVLSGAQDPSAFVEAFKEAAAKSSA